MSFVALPDNSGYAGLFFMAISPLFIFVFMIWTLLLAVINQKKRFPQISRLSSVPLIFEYLAATITM
ncbi:hypothetical protein [Empedobacter brevis]|uniref:hypothetical protein n=1 Tax=Empedobacter brevis TaxID=247 RepID=UPI00036998EF|nr:hypothetical protein [Empedobacter brevis]